MGQFAAPHYLQYTQEFHTISTGLRALFGNAHKSKLN